MLTVREGIGVTQAEVYDVFRQHFKSGTEGNDIIEVTIFSYSSGKESFFYSNDTGDNITRNTDDGSIEALIKVRENNRLVDAVFFKAEGRSKEELINKIAAEIISSFP
jgi:ribosome biogenesis protein Nip4